MRRLTEIFKGVAALVCLLALTVGVPLVLVRVKGWPGPTEVPTWDSMSEAWARGSLSDQVVVNVLFVALWLAWANVVRAVLIEVGAALRNRDARTLRAGLGMQVVARRLVATVVVMLTMSVPQARSVAQAAPLRPIPVTAPAVVAAPVAAPSAVPAVGVLETRASGPVYVTGAQDRSWVDVAQRVLGDGMRWREIRDLNVGRTVEGGVEITATTDQVEAGWSLQVPGEATVAPTPVASSPTPPGTAVPVGSGVDVVGDDNLWAISQQRLTEAWGRPVSDEEVVPYWAQVVEESRPQLAPPGDPSVIYPGQHFELPAPGPDPLAAPAATAATVPVDEPTAPSAASAPAAPLPVGAGEATTPPGPEPSTTIPTPTTATPVPTTAMPATTPASENVAPAVAGPTGTSTPAPVVESADEADVGEVWPALIPAVGGITGFTVLASGVLMALRRARRRRDTISARLPRPDEWQRSPLEKAIIAAADVPLVRWAGQELAELFTRVSPAALLSAPVAVELSEEHGIELLWDRPASGAPAPWEAFHGGWTWRLLYDENAPVPAPELPCPIAGLVTLGERDGRQVLFDLESCGTLAVVGDPAAAEAVVRSMVLELGGGDELADAYVLTVGLDVDGVEQFRRVSTATADEAIRRLAGTARQVGDALDETGLATTFAQRLGADVPPIEVLVAAVRSELGDELRDLAAAAATRRGVAAIVLGDVVDAGARLEVAADGTARLEPLGLDLRAVGVDRELAAQLAVLLDQAEQPVFDPAVPISEQMALLDRADFAGVDPPAEVDAVPAEESVRLLGDPEAVIDLDALPGPVDEPFVVAPRLLVRVLGTPSVPDRPGLNRREVALAALLACTDGPLSRDSMQEAVWKGKAVEKKTVYNVISGLRTGLGELADGEPVIGRITGGFVELGPGVGTDLDMFCQLYALAKRESSGRATEALHQALDLIEGPPFSGECFEWAGSQQQLLSKATGTIEKAAALLVELSLDAGDLDEARYAVQQGLRALPGNEILYRARMQIESAAGNPSAVRSAYQELLDLLDDLDTEPSAETAELYGQLVPSGRPRRT